MKKKRINIIEMWVLFPFPKKSVWRKITITGFENKREARRFVKACEDVWKRGLVK